MSSAHPASKSAISRGVAWVGVATSVVAVLDTIALALILHLWVDTDEFGVVTGVVTLFAALGLAAELGLPAAMVQTDHTDEDRISTMFWLGIASGLAFYAVVWALAPLFAALHGHSEETLLFRVTGLLLVVRPLYMTHHSLLRAQLRFKDLSYVRVIANSVEFATKVGTAAGGLGVWCFVLGPLAREVVTAVGVPLASRWLPRRVFKPRLVGHDVKFGLRSSSGEILYALYSNLDYQVVGTQFGAEALGAYRAAYELVLEPVRFVSGVVTVVAFPTFARLRQNATAVGEQLITFTRQNLVVVLVMLGVIVVCADDALTVFAGAQYASMANAARVLAIVGVLRAVSHLGPPLLDGLGRPELTLRYQLFATVALSTMYVVMSSALHSQGAFSVAIAWAIGYPLAFALLVYMVFEQLELKLAAYVRAFWKIPVLVVIGSLVGLGVKLMVGGLTVPLRFALTGGTVVVVSFALLGTLEAYSPRAIIRSLRS